MPELRPFRAHRYAPGVALADVVAPPYDVVDPARRAALAASHPHNVVHLDLPEEEEGRNRYEAACRRLRSWVATGVLVADDEPSLTVYRMEFTGADGRPRHTHGVIGALALHHPEEGEILPHERTTPTASTDRLEMLRACRANLSAIWCLAPVAGLTAAATVEGPPDAAWDGTDGTRHMVWRITDPDRIGAIGSAVAASPVLIADGHHRYETALRYREERRAAGDGPGPWDRTLAYVVELAPEELSVLPIHRLVDLAPGTDLAAALDPWFRASEVPAGVPDADLEAAAADAGVAVLLTRRGRWFLEPRADAFAGVRDLDTSRLDTALPATAGVRAVRYQHGLDQVLDALAGGEADGAVLVRPPSIGEIEAIAHGGERMPPKTTFFSPKPSTGAVFRLFDAG